MFVKLERSIFVRGASLIRIRYYDILYLRQRINIKFNQVKIEKANLEACSS